MARLRKSPERFTFQRDAYIERCLKDGKSLDDENVVAMINYYNNWAECTATEEADPSWAKNNLEYDLRATDWIVEKVKASDAYAQNLYAALCNNDFINRELWPQLKGETWSCSWRYAGGIIADIKEEGDYIDWYCSGIRDIDYDEEVNKAWDNRKYVAESVVTDEIKDDLYALGWIVIEDRKDDPI